MGDFLALIGIFLEEFPNVSFDLYYIVYGIFSLIFSAAVVFLLTILYKKIRNLPVKVNCWFCNNNTSVSYNLTNSWDCPHCKQYNGFNKDGSYNKVIEEQYNSKLNTDVFMKPTNSYNNAESNGFCKLCNINQQLKIQQLALFTPIDENNYYKEIEEYREKLEKAYALCSKCEGVLKETLEKQEYNLLQNRLNGHHKKTISSQKFKDINQKKLKQLVNKNGVIGLHWICLFIALLQFFILVVMFNAEHQIVSFTLPEFELSKEVFKNFTYYVPVIYRFNKELSFTGFIVCLLTCVLKQVKREYKNLLLWALLCISFWSTCAAIQLPLSGICMFVSAKAAKKQFIYIEKKLLHKKSGFQPVEKVFPEVNNFPIKDENVKFSNQKDIKEMKKSDLEKPKKKPRKEENEESCQDKVKNSDEPVGSVEPEVEMSPFAEMYNGLNSLHIGGKQKKSHKSNFLFSTPDYSQVKNSSIIKPAKLIKNLNSWSESSEYNSRSSTPSSQKTENRFDFSKTMPTSPFNRPSPINPINCWDYNGSTGLYNNFSYLPHGFIPVGHTTIYTSSRPTNFPHPFSPWQSFPSPKFSPTSRFSDSSDCDNLFRETSKNYEKQKTWFKLKKFSYYFSICMNIFTVVGLFYFISSGIILVDWKLPTLNFFQ